MRFTVDWSDQLMGPTMEKRCMFLYPARVLSIGMYRIWFALQNHAQVLKMPFSLAMFVVISKRHLLAQVV
ncbi:hypothetical protein ROS217_08775 [Roseovarius sp. 217]|nr:hypothetical protein ROS217_08775 [Roseovarius sp. 217]